jgi:hypothetical protein
MNSNPILKLFIFENACDNVNIACTEHILL